MIMAIETVALDDLNSQLVLIDQTQLPGKVEILYLSTQEEIREAIYLLKVRGAPAIGVAAAFGVYLAAKSIQTDEYDAFLREYQKCSKYLEAARCGKPFRTTVCWISRRNSIPATI